MTESGVAHRWRPIEGLPADWHRLAHPELVELRSRWARAKETIRDPSRVRELEERLGRRWAIETGILERLYTMDLGVTESIVELGMESAAATLRIERPVLQLIEDQRAALEFVFAFLRDERPLGTSYIKELHQLFTRHQLTTMGVDQFGNRRDIDLIRGDWKRWPNNPTRPDGLTHEFCPPEQVAPEIDRLLEQAESQRRTGVAAEVASAFLHHRFTAIHPFQDGNGRVARALATLVFLRDGYLPLVVGRDDRDAYLDALAAADAGDLGGLVRLFAQIQARDLDQAITYVREIRGGLLADVVRSVAAIARDRSDPVDDALYRRVESWKTIAFQRLSEVRAEMDEAFAEQGLVLVDSVFASGSTDDGSWLREAAEVAEQHGYSIATDARRGWVALTLGVPDDPIPGTSVVVSFHCKRTHARVAAVEVFATSATPLGTVAHPVYIGSDAELTLTAGSAIADDDFRVWLDDAIRNALSRWQAQF